MEPAELSAMLKRFYVEAGNVEGKPYSRKAIRFGLDRFLSGSSQRKPFSIIRDREFKPANEGPDASLKDLARQGLDLLYKTQASNIQRRPRSPLCRQPTRPGYSGKSRKYSLILHSTILW